MNKLETDLLIRKYLGDDVFSELNHDRFREAYEREARSMRIRFGAPFAVDGTRLLPRPAYIR